MMVINEQSVDGHDMNILSGRRERKKTLWVGGTLMHSLNWGRGVQPLVCLCCRSLLLCGGYGMGSSCGWSEFSLSQGFSRDRSESERAKRGESEQAHT